MNIVQRALRSQEGGATAETVATALRSRNAASISGVMSEHRITAFSNTAASQRFEVHDTTSQLSDTWRPGRVLGWLRPHRVRTFQLRPQRNEGEHAPLLGAPTGRAVDASFVPMTRSQEWGGRYSNVGQAVANTETVRLARGEIGVTGELTGCSLVRLANGSIGHLQPPQRAVDNTAKPLPGIRAERRLLAAPGVQSAFGPIEYGRVRGSSHDRTNTIMIGGGATAPTTVVSQSLHRAGQLSTSTESHQLRRITTQRAAL